MIFKYIFFFVGIIITFGKCCAFLLIIAAVDVVVFDFVTADVAVVVLVVPFYVVYVVVDIAVVLPDVSGFLTEVFFSGRSF